MSTDAATCSAPLDWSDGQEVILYEHCGACGKASYFRRGFCPRCGATPVAVRKSAGNGTVYASTTVVRAPSPEWKGIAPYAIVLVNLEEGIRILSHGTPGLAIGDQVRIGWLHIGERLIPRAEPVTPATAGQKKP
jgi:uncharacterized OB-fold protein